MSRGQSEPRHQSVKRVLERCRTRETIEIIDVEEKINLVIVDAEEASDRVSSRSGTIRRNRCPSNVISIDDDDGDADDTLRNVHADAAGKEYGSSSSNSSVSEEQDCNVSSMPIRMGNPCYSKSVDYTRKYHDIGPSVGRYGLDYSYEGCSSDSDSTEFISSKDIGTDRDSSDCEIIEGSSGNIREQWERAASRKRMSDRVPYGSEGLASASGLSADASLSSPEATCSKVDIENCINMVHTNHSEEMLAEICTSNPNSTNENLLFNIHSPAEPGKKFRSNSTDLDTDTTNSAGPKEPRCGSKTFSCRVQSTHEPFSENPTSILRDPNIKDDDVTSFDKNEHVPNGTTFGTSGLHSEFNFPGKAASVPGQLDGEQFFPDSTVQDKNNSLDGKHSFSLEPQFMSVASLEIAGFQEKEMSSFYVHSLCHDQCSDSPVLNGEKNSLKESPTFHTNEGRTFGKSISFDTGSGDIPHTDNGLFCREKHKESDEYKRAVEEEWAARQHQLQIQAEEVQRLKRRRKAETLRLLDMEKRQKQRLEEMRESQKKDEETITLKEHIRAEVREELDKMELRYRDMASLLRGLGIHVNGGVFPMPHEVSAAYKQALLKFHPDRASKSDLREHVKAEEIFKLISRLKEKLMP